MPVSCGSCTWVCQVFFGMSITLQISCAEKACELKWWPSKKPLYCSHFLFREVANFGVAKMPPQKKQPYRQDQWIKVDAGPAGEWFVRPCRLCQSDFVWRYGCINARCVPRRSISIFFYPLTLIAQKKVLEWHFFMQKTTKDDYEKIWKNPEQYQHKRFKQSATCHIFYICKIPQNDSQKRLGIIRVICQIEKSQGEDGRLAQKIPPK